MLHGVWRYKNIETGNLFFPLSEILEFLNSGAFRVNWTRQVQVGWVGRCQVPPVCSSVQVNIGKASSSDVWIVTLRHMNFPGLKMTEQYPSFHLMESLSWCPTDSTPMSRYLSSSNYHHNSPICFSQFPATDMDWVSDWATRAQQDRNYGQSQVPVQEKVGNVLFTSSHIFV